MLTIPLIYSEISLKDHAEKLSRQWKLKCLSFKESTNQYDFILQLTPQSLQLIHQAKQQVNPLSINFSSGNYNHRRLFGGGKNQLIAKAVGLNKGFTPYVLDATAGLARDAFVLASLGCRITLLERSPIIGALLEDGLSRAINNAEIKDIIQRMKLIPIDSQTYFLPQHFQEIEKPDIIYLDPMYPEKKGSAQVKKEMQFLHEVVGKDMDSYDLLEAAINLAQYRVVVKRPKTAGFLNNKKPSLQLSEKKQRYDIYIKQKLPLKPKGR